MLSKDNDGRYRLSNAEWCTLKTIFGAYNVLLNDKHVLEERLRTIPKAWCDYNCIVALIGILLDKLLDTVPTKKLYSIKKELENTTFTAKMKNAVSVGSDLVVCDAKAYVDLINMAVANQCFLCTKDEKQAKRCRLYKDIQEVLPFEIPETEDGKCIMAERLTIPLSIGSKDDDE